MSAPLPVTLTAVAVLAGASVSTQTPAPAVERLLVDVLGFSAAQLTSFRRGDAVTTAMPGALDREIVIAGAVRIETPAERTVGLVRDIEHFESGARFLSRTRVSDPPSLGDFAGFSLTPEDLAALRRCRPGRCEVKLDRDGFAAVAAIDWSAADAGARANAVLRERTLGVLSAYRAGGNGASIVYHDRESPVVVATEFAEMVTRSAALGAVSGDLPQVLLRYPEGQPPDAESFFFWSVSDLGLKPVFRLNHVVVHRRDATPGPRYVMATRLLYATHYFNAASRSARSSTMPRARDVRTSWSP